MAFLFRLSWSVFLFYCVRSIEDWARDSDGMLTVNSLDEMKVYIQSTKHQTMTLPKMWLTWVEDPSCNASQSEDLQESIRAAVNQLPMIPTLRWKVSVANAHIPTTETPALFLTTMNETSRYTVEYSGSYHDIPGTVLHYFDWLIKWSTSKYDERVSSITLEESKPKMFASKQAIFEYWKQEFTNVESIPDPLLLVYYHQDPSKCSIKERSTWNASSIQRDMVVFEQFATTVAGRRDRYFFYSRACRPQLHVYDTRGDLLYDYNDTALDLQTFLIQSASDAILQYHRELTAPIAMAHTVQIVALFHDDMLQAAECKDWKRRNAKIICMVVPDTEKRLIAALGLESHRVVVVDEEQRRYIQPPDMAVDRFVEHVVFQKQSLDSQPETVVSEGGIAWIEQSGIALPDNGIVVAVVRTCGHCQRMLAILYRLEGLLAALGWTDRFPLYVIDVTKSDVVQPYWLPALYYNGVESTKRSFRDETEILEWIFEQMNEDHVTELLQSL